MNISKENIDALNAVLTIEFEKADYEPKVEKAVKDYAKRVAIKGFRPGHAPVGMVKKFYGKSLLVDQINNMVGEQLSLYIKENNLDILGEPLPSKDQQPIDFDGEVDKLVFKFDLGLSPEVSVALDNNIAVPAYTINVDDKAIDEHVQNLCSRFGSHVAAEAAGADSLLKGSVVCGEAKNEKCVASVSVVKEEAKAAFIGKKVGDAVEFDVRATFNDNREISYLLGISEEEAAAIAEGTKATLTLTDVTDFKNAELNKELFDKVYAGENIEDEAAFRAKVKETISSTNAMAEDYRFHVDARKALMDKAGDIQLPEEFLKRWLTMVNQNNDKFTPEVLDNEFPKFVEDLKWQVVKNRVAKANDIKIESADIIEFAKKTARAQFLQYGITNLPEERLAEYAANMVQNEEQRGHLVEGAVEDKLFAIVKEKVSVENKGIDQEGFNKLFEAEN